MSLAKHGKKALFLGILLLFPQVRSLLIRPSLSSMASKAMLPNLRAPKVLYRRNIRASIAADGRDGLTVDPKLSLYCSRVDACFKEICLQNHGRSVAESLHDFISTTCSSLRKGYSRTNLLICLYYLDQERRTFAAGRLTTPERTARSRWIISIHLTLQALAVIPQEEIFTDEEAELSSQIDVIIKDYMNDDEAVMLALDRPLLSYGSQGIASEKRTVPPMMLPICQIVLFTLKIIANASDQAQG